MELEAIQKKARQCLLLSTEQGEPDLFLWEHALQVAQNARRIASFPDVTHLRVDDLAVYIAGLFLDAGWALQVRRGDISRLQALSTPTTSALCEQAAGVLEQTLSGMVPAELMERSSRAVRSCHDRDTASAEGQILAEAQALGEFGVLSVWVSARRAALEGRSITFAIDGWRRKKEYHYWTARMRDAFRFESVRDIARRRLERFERVIAEMELENAGEDIKIVGMNPKSDRLATPHQGS